jgi:hypothetical protein
VPSQGDGRLGQSGESQLFSLAMSTAAIRVELAFSDEIGAQIERESEKLFH